MSDAPIATRLLARFRVALGWVFGPLVLLVAEPTTGSFAVGIASHSLIVIAMIALYLGLTITAAIKTEEAYLRSVFGEFYDRFKRGEIVRDNDARRRFSFAQAIGNHEHRAVAGFVVAWLLLALKATYNSSLWR